ncbi:MAG: hypothetical protein GXP63_04985 [DPANN group archaeon]|nr:hypothetical protein [DPANN group archaeon]
MKRAREQRRQERVIRRTSHAQPASHHLIQLIHLTVFLLIVSLYVLGVPVQTAAGLESITLDQLEALQQKADDLQASGINMEQVHPLLNQTREYLLHHEQQLAMQKYQKAVTLIGEIQRLQTALDTEQKLIADMQKRNMDTGAAEEHLAQASEEFILGNTKGADRHLRETEEAASRIIRERYGPLLDRVKDLAEAPPGTGTVSSERTLSREWMDRTDTLIDESLSKGDLDRLDAMEQNIGRIEQFMGTLQEDRKTEDLLLLEDETMFDDLEAEIILRIELNQLDGAALRMGRLKQLLAEASQTKESIDNLQGQIEKHRDDLDLEPEKQELIVIRKLFSKHQFSRAKEQADGLLQKIDDRRAQHLIMKSLEQPKTIGFSEMLRRYWSQGLFVLVIIIFLALLVSTPLKESMVNRKIEKYKKEQETILSLIRRRQTEYFKERAISKTDYDESYERFQDRLAIIESRLPPLEKRLEEIKEKGKDKKDQKRQNGNKEEEHR